MPEPQPVSKVSLSFAKLVATPTDTAWSQAYNAGNLFVCLSLSIEEIDEEISLQALGKDLFSVLQSEFFTLQEKNTESIKAAIKTSLESVPQSIICSLTLTFFKDTTLFVFIAGAGKVVMKRAEKVGTLLSEDKTDNGDIISASGYIQNNDTLVLETGQFATGISQDTVKQALELVLPNDVVEALSPQIHKQDNGSQAAIVIIFKGASHQKPETFEAEEEIAEEQKMDTSYTENADKDDLPEPNIQFSLHNEPEEAVSKKQLFKLPTFSKIHFSFQFNHRRRLYFNIALVITVLLILSIYFTFKKYNDDKEKALFQSIYPTAQQDYSEAQGLATVNPSLSQENYQKAEQLLIEGEQKFPKNSPYQQQLATLLTQVQGGLQGNTAGQTSKATTIQAPSNSLLAVEQSMSDGLAFGQDTNNIYVITNTAITTVSKSDGTTNAIIKNNGDWSNPVAIVPYEDNIYVLDQKDGLLKFVPSSGGYGKTKYFTGTAPDLSQATGMAIDGSIWILWKNGSIMDYTKGVSNGISLSGLTKPLNNPTQILTDITMESIYILDNGNERITQFDKNGKYQSAYSDPVVANAKGFTVSETNKNAQVLSGGKVYQISF
jgi:hypothetical protein